MQSIQSLFAEAAAECVGGPLLGGMSETGGRP